MATFLPVLLHPTLTNALSNDYLNILIISFDNQIREVPIHLQRVISLRREKAVKINKSVPFLSLVCYALYWQRVPGEILKVLS